MAEQEREKEMTRTLFTFRIPTRAEWRKYTFKKQDGVLKSLEYIVHTTITDPPLADFIKLEQEQIMLTEQLGQRLVDDLLCLNDSKQEKIVIDVTTPMIPMNAVSHTIDKNEEAITVYSGIKAVVEKVLKEHKLI